MSFRELKAQIYWPTTDQKVRGSNPCGRTLLNLRSENKINTNPVIYGTGNVAKLWLQSEKNFKPKYFLTSEKYEDMYLGIPVSLPLELLNREKYHVLISVNTLDSQTYRNSTGLLFGDKLIDYLHSIGFAKVYSLEESSKIFFPNFLKQKDANVAFSWTSDSNYKTAHNYDLENGFKLKVLEDKLFDEKSKKLFHKIIKFRKTLDFSHYPRPESNYKQYLEPDFINKIDNITMLDLGSYNGDSAEDFINQHSEKIDYIYCVEPSIENQKVLKDFCKSNQIFIEKIIPIMCAMGSKSGLAKIIGSGNDARITDYLNVSKFATSESIIPMCTIDGTFKNLGINLIKMDIEGAELDVLIGAKNYISKKSPFLALAIYHKPTDLFDIPNEILKINPNYYFMLRVYSENLRELVLYCIPENL